MAKQAEKKDEGTGFKARHNTEYGIVGFLATFPERSYECQRLGEGHFSDTNLGKCFRVIMRLIDEKGAAAVQQMTTLVAELTHEGIAEATAFALLTKANDYIPNPPSGISHLVETLANEVFRQSIKGISGTIQSIASDKLSTDEMVDQITSVVNDAVRAGITTNFRSMEEEMQAEIERAEREEGLASAVPGIPLGIPELDDLLCGGARPGELIIIAARPSMGKSALAGQVAAYFGECNEPGGLYSLEMMRREYLARMICARAKVDSRLARIGRMSGTDRKNYIDACRGMKKWPIFIDDTAGLTLPRIASGARRMKYEHGIKWLVIDYLQQINPMKMRNESTNDAVSRVSGGLKTLARQLEIPVIALSQLNREVEKREDHMPRMSDLRDSGSLEQDADIIILMRREEYYHQDDVNWEMDNPDKAGTVDLIVAKQRNGPTGIVRVPFDKRFGRFGDRVTSQQALTFSDPFAHQQSHEHVHSRFTGDHSDVDERG